MSSWDIPKNDQLEILERMFDVLHSDDSRSFIGFTVEDDDKIPGIYRKDFEQKEYSPQLIYLTNDAKSHLKNCGLHVNELRGNIEFHRYNVQGECKGVFDYHEDDCGGVSYKVETVIYYFKKDKNIKGGDLLISNRGHEYTIDVTPKEGHVKVLAFSGKLIHKVTDMIGQGIRDCIVVQLYSLRNN